MGDGIIIQAHEAEKPAGVQLQRPAAEGIAKTGFGAKVEGAYARSNNTGGVETKFKFLEKDPSNRRAAIFGFSENSNSYIFDVQLYTDCTGLGELVVSAQITVDLNLNKQYSPG